MRTNQKSRIEAIEGKLNLAAEAETLEAMMTAFNRGDYGEHSVMSIVAAIQSGGEQTVRETLPGPLADFFISTIQARVETEAGEVAEQE